MEIEQNDADLVRQISAEGNREAEAELVKRMAPRIRHYGLRHLRDPHATEDLVQHVLVTTIESLREGRVRDPDKLGSFVLGTCRMTVLDTRRNALRKERLLDGFVADELQKANYETPGVDHEQLGNCVQKLNEREKAVVLMTFFDEETGSNVARFLGVTESNVRVIRHRALTQLRNCMGVAA